MNANSLNSGVSVFNSERSKGTKTLAPNKQLGGVVRVFFVIAQKSALDDGYPLSLYRRSHPSSRETFGTPEDLSSFPNSVGERRPRNSVSRRHLPMATSLSSRVFRMVVPLDSSVRPRKGTRNGVSPRCVPKRSLGTRITLVRFQIKSLRGGAARLPISVCVCGNVGNVGNLEAVRTSSDATLAPNCEEFINPRTDPPPSPAAVPAAVCRSSSGLIAGGNTSVRGGVGPF